MINGLKKFSNRTGGNTFLPRGCNPAKRSQKLGKLNGNLSFTWETSEKHIFPRYSFPIRYSFHTCQTQTTSIASPARFSTNPQSPHNCQARPADSGQVRKVRVELPPIQLPLLCFHPSNPLLLGGYPLLYPGWVPLWPPNPLLRFAVKLRWSCESLRCFFRSKTMPSRGVACYVCRQSGKVEWPVIGR